MRGFINIRKSFFFLLLLLLLFSSTLHAQFYQGYQMPFGKNRVEYNEFYWTFYRFPRFDTYFYPGGQELALFTSRVAGTHLEEIEKLFDYRLDGRIQFLVFNKLSDLKQSNLGLANEEPYNIGGVTKIIGSKIFLYFDGNHKHFEQQIRAGIARVLINQLLFGGSIKDVLQSAALLTLPDWYVVGLVSFVSRQWNVDIDNRVRDGILSGKFKHFNRLSGEDAEYAGHSIWRYITDVYGMQSVSNLLYMTRLNRNIESGFLFVLGNSSRTLSDSWLSYYHKKYALSEKERGFPGQAPLPVRHAKSYSLYSNLKISPDGHYAAYVRNDMGKYKVFVRNLSTGKVRRVCHDGYKSVEQKLDETFPILAWHPGSRMLSVIRERKGKKMLLYYYPEMRKREQNPVFNIEKILDFSYSDDGQYLVMSAVQQGQSDIFLYNLRAHAFEQLTKDIYDDFNPRFAAHSSAILFSSDRVSDTLRTASPDSLPPAGNFDIFEYDLRHKSPVLKRITSTPSYDETQPLELDSAHLMYLSDENGIVNRCIAHLDSAISYIDTSEHYRDVITVSHVTDYSRNILSQDFTKKSRKYAEILYQEGHYRMYLADFPKLESMLPVHPEPTGYRRQSYDVSSPVIAPEKIKTPGVMKEEKPAAPEDSTKIDIDNYVFGGESRMRKPKPAAETHAGAEMETRAADSSSRSSAVPKQAMLPKLRRYNVAFATNYILTQLDNSLIGSAYQLYTGGGAVYFNPGMNGLVKIAISDLFEDYRVTGGFRYSGDPGNNEYFMSYENLKRRLDKQILFYRQGRLYGLPNDVIVRVHTHEFKYAARWPFNDISAVKGTIAYRSDRAVYLSTDLQTLQEPNLYASWVSLKGEYIYDNTISRGLNLYNGLRFKLFAEFFQQDKKETSLSILGADFRYYQKIHREIVWANRFAASTSFGKEKLIYYLGATDNWFNPRFDTSIPIDNNQNYAYQAIATNMRGFQQNIRNGNSFAVVNSELRMPVFRYFISRPIKSDFVKNFQVIGFADVGTAWTGPSPYDSTNSLYTQTVTRGPVTVTLFSRREPLVAGYGWGLRSRILGYFARADWAWGYEDGIIRPRMFYFSLSLDF